MAYFKCEDPACHRKFLVPGGPGDINNAREIGYKLYVLEKCPKHSIWSGTEDLMAHPIFIAGMRYKDLPVCGNSLIDQPVTFGHLIHHGRQEYEWFRTLVAERRRKR